jgi:hypothetical protein
MRTAAVYRQKEMAMYANTEKCLTLFPSIRNEGYHPFLPYSLLDSRPGSALEAVTTTLQVSPNNKVCFFKPGTPNREFLPLAQLNEKRPEYNLCVMPADGSWLLYHTENKSWQWGKQHEHSHLFDPCKKRFFIRWGSGGLTSLKNIITPVVAKMETVFDIEDFSGCEQAFRSSKTDSFIYIIRGNEAWFEICMNRDKSYYDWQCLTHDRTKLESCRSWFYH